MNVLVVSGIWPPDPGSIDEFQREAGGGRVRLLSWARDAALRRACHVFCPSENLREIAAGSRLSRRSSAWVAGRLVRPKVLDVARGSAALHTEEAVFSRIEEEPGRAVRR